MELTPFSKADIAQLIKWIDSPQLNYLWSGPVFQFPLTEAQIIDHYKQKEVIPYLCQVDGRNAGYIELFRQGGGEFRLCRVFISAPFRGQGYSHKLIDLAIHKACAEFGANKLSLAVFSQNTPAKRCYHSLGFVTTKVESGTRNFNGEIWDLEIMEKALPTSTLPASSHYLTSI
ncbi:hypothetical protein A3K86_16275 [Photobacterium jeanii]|uniref:N-acetyltransferase domain-containing protein n=1 Tax=Photobacterium jeanii TaxID=858640 RepID=A0A178K950_9GAMM|nr:GNAT family N-acetyltransferase [Photobacterium jeanii]OAN13212.1 hypothetical protein A3K86_16275 [Photobacterium jeanii]PST89363.1 N-acetyltransferase [Photobacterium jeanii]